MGGCHAGFCDKIPNGDHSTTDRSGTARTRSGTANHPQEAMLDMAEVRGQERAKRALEIATAGRHHVF